MALNLQQRISVVDSLKATEIVVSFSSLSFWNELPAAVAAAAETKATPMKQLGVRDAKSDRESRMADIPSDQDTSAAAAAAPTPYVAGTVQKSMS